MCLFMRKMGRCFGLTTPLKRKGEIGGTAGVLDRRAVFGNASVITGQNVQVEPCAPRRFFFFWLLLGGDMVIWRLIFLSWQSMSALSDAQEAGTESITKPPHKQSGYLISWAGFAYTSVFFPPAGNR